MRRLSLCVRYPRSDVFLAKPVHGTTVCDWHVDDQQFWPAQFGSTASQRSGKDQHGVNVWVSLDDMPADCAGSMAVAPGSHRAEWRERAYEALGQNRSADVDLTLDDVINFFSNPSRRGTCTIGNVDVELREMIEKLSVVVDVKRGDCIFCTRLLFHRTLDVTEKGKSHYSKATLNRYSIRYVPGSTRLPGVYNSLDWAHMADEANAGRSLDEVVALGACCWYPLVWPTVELDVDDKLDEMSRTALVEAKAKLDSKTKELFAAVGQRKIHDSANAANDKEEKGK
jgi:Phytanoyl-CoA dioxygenase (PhyH)